MKTKEIIGYDTPWDDEPGHDDQAWSDHIDDMIDRIRDNKY